MKRGQVFLIVLLSLTLTGFDFLGFAYHTWHQKMTIEVEVEGQTYLGSSVVGMSVFGHPEMPLSTSVRDLDMHGEAVVVELPNQQYLFGLLTYNAFLAQKVFKDKMDGALRETGERWAKIISELRESREMDPKEYPLLVTFTDIHDPKSVKKVDPDNLVATFGPGVSLKRITLEITDEPVTKGKVERVLGKILIFKALEERIAEKKAGIYDVKAVVNQLNKFDFIRE